jgi:hypothetical protein
MTSTAGTPNSGSGLLKGASVKVRPSVKDPNDGLDLSGWQGRVISMDEKDGYLGIVWDSITLQSIPDSLIARWEEDGMDWKRYNLYISDVEQCAPRDDEKTAEEVADRIQKRHEWDCLGKKGRRIQAVLSKASDDEDLSEVTAWESHLRSLLRFPFRANLGNDSWEYPLKFYSDEKETAKSLLTRMVSRILQIVRDTPMVEPPSRTSVPATFNVTEIIGSDERFGVMVEVEHEGRTGKYPLCDLKCKIKDNDQARALKDYRAWIANR